MTENQKMKFFSLACFIGVIFGVTINLYDNFYWNHNESILENASMLLLQVILGGFVGFTFVLLIILIIASGALFFSYLINKEE